MGYIEKMVTGIMPRVKYMGLAEFCDVFCEDGVFSIEESEYILKIAKKMGCKWYWFYRSRQESRFCNIWCTKYRVSNVSFWNKSCR